MQSLGWYWRRLATMSAAEVTWRVARKLRGFVERAIPPMMARPGSLDRPAAAGEPADMTTPGALGAHLESSDLRFSGVAASVWLPPLVDQANSVVAHRLGLFHLDGCELGPEIQWNFEYEAGKATPLVRAERIDYRDYASVGDCKLVWEPNRHHQLVVLGRAYRVTGDERYATEACLQIESWLNACPLGMGMNWRSPLELAIRVINWTWAYALLDNSDALTPALRSRIVTSVHQHVRQIDREYSRFSSANNHLIGEAAGVFIAASYFSGLPSATAWRDRARRILEREILQQTHPDGGSREQATGYQLFVMEFFTLAALVGRNRGEGFSAEYRHRLERMYEFVAALTSGGNRFPMIGDADDGYVLDVGGRTDRAASWLSIAAVLFGRGDWRARASVFSEPAFWLLGPDARPKFEALSARPSSDELRSRPLPGAGYFLLQHGRRGTADAVSVIFDCGELGYLSIAAHGHADALALLVRIAGRDVLVDPGTYDYFTHPRWRSYFRSTSAHNTIEVDGLDQSEMLGSFMWGRRANARLIRWAPDDHGGTVIGQHDGYARLSDPVVHRRTVTLQDAVLTVRDELCMVGRHAIAQYWHFGEHCRVTEAGRSRFEVDFGAGRAVFEMDQALTTHAQTGSEDPLCGWLSRGYHEKVATQTVIGRLNATGAVSLTTRLEINPA